MSEKTQPKYKPGDKVRCVDLPEGMSIGEYKNKYGLGSEPGKLFDIHYATPYDHSFIYWPVSGAGVYEHTLIPVTELYPIH